MHEIKSFFTEQTYEYSFWLSVCKSGRSAFPRNWFISDAKFSDSSSLMLETVMIFSSIWWDSIESEVENNAICVMCAANNIRRKWCSLWCELDWTVYFIFFNQFHLQDWKSNWVIRWRLFYVYGTHFSNTRGRILMKLSLMNAT